MKPSRDSKYTSGDGILSIEIISRGAPITDEARERARKRGLATGTRPVNEPTDPKAPDQKNPTDPPE